MKYAACAFSDKEGAKTYDYAADQDYQKGDIVKVPSARGEGWQKVFVVAMKTETDVPEQFIKTIIGKVEEDGEEKATAV